MTNMAKRVEYMQSSVIRELLKLCGRPGMISFAGGFPAAELFPIEQLKKVDNELLDSSGRSALQYSSTEGFLPLREHIVEIMKISGIESNADDILITNGSQQGLSFTAKLFIDEGDVIITESPSYLGALGTFKAYNPKFIEVKTDENGMDMEALESELKSNKNVKFIYVIPDFQNPTGRSMSVDRRKKIVELAEKYDTIILEDGPYGALRFDGENIPAIKHFDKYGRVIYLGTMSKIFAPGLRIGWIVAKSEYLNKFNTIKQNEDLQSGTFVQQQMSLFLDKYDIGEHIAKISKVYGKRKNLMLKTMEEEFPKEVIWTNPNGGLFTWVTLPEGIDAKIIFDKAVEELVAFVPGEPFYPNGGNSNHFRLNYSCMPEDIIVEGIKRLGKVLKAVI